MKGNTLYVMIAMVAVGLIGVTIGLQLVILLERSQVTVPENLHTANAEVALAISSTETSTLSFMQSTPAPPMALGDTATSETAGAGSVPTGAGETTPETTVATLSAATVTTIPSQSDVDFSIGYLEERIACALITEIIAEILETEFDSSTRRIAFTNTDLMYQNMAESRQDSNLSIQLTPCFIDPADRAYLRMYNTGISLIGDAYREVETNKYYIASHLGLTPTLEFDNPCVLRFLSTLNFQDLDTVDTTAQQWITEHADLVASWSQCN